MNESFPEKDSSSRQPSFDELAITDSTYRGYVERMSDIENRLLRLSGIDDRANHLRGELKEQLKQENDGFEARRATLQGVWERYPSAETFHKGVAVTDIIAEGIAVGTNPGDEYLQRLAAARAELAEAIEHHLSQE